ncbi:MAG: hypothetical protein II700_07775 [Firmicutes bacterium]|nr:hypothetical protein [Bacillota bacterium]
MITAVFTNTFCPISLVYDKEDRAWYLEEYRKALAGGGDDNVKAYVIDGLGNRKEVTLDQADKLSEQNDYQVYYDDDKNLILYNGPLV